MRKPAWVLICCVAASLALRAVIYVPMGLYNDPWIYRFFPTELAFFLGGALAYRAYRRLRAAGPPGPLVRAVAATYIAAVILAQLIPDPPGIGEPGRRWVFYALTWLAIPSLFIATARSRWDRYIGELSCPMYIVHWLVIAVVTRVVNLPAFQPISRWTPPIVAVVTVLAAILLHHAVSVPLERLRQGRARALSGIETGHHAPPQQ